MTSPNPLIRRKASLRTEALRRRADIAASYGERAAETVARRLEDELAIAPGATVAGYWPLAGELDPRPAMDRLRDRGHALALPRLDGGSRPLLFLAWDAGDVLVPGTFGLLEPHASRPPRLPAVVLVPLLAFDRRGGRLGYGKGYYDRTLGRLRAQGQRPLAIGIAFAAQEIEEVPTGPSDVPLDGVVTEIALHRFGDRGAGGS